MGGRRKRDGNDNLHRFEHTAAKGRARGGAALILALTMQPLLWAGPGPAARAQSPQAEGANDPSQDPIYREVIHSAIAEYEQSNFAEARALFRRAHALYPNARTLRGLGLTEFVLKNYRDSILRLEAALASQEKPLTGELRESTEQTLAEARAFVGRFTLQVKPESPPSQVLVDGLTETLPESRQLTLNVGEHRLVVAAPGFEDAVRALSVKGGEEQPLTIELRPLGGAPAAALSSAPGETRAAGAPERGPGEEDSTLWESPWLWAGMGAVVAGAVIAGIALSAGPTTADPVSGDLDGVIKTLGVR